MVVVEEAKRERETKLFTTPYASIQLCEGKVVKEVFRNYGNSFQPLDGAPINDGKYFLLSA